MKGEVNMSGASNWISDKGEEVRIEILKYTEMNDTIYVLAYFNMIGTTEIYRLGENLLIPIIDAQERKLVYPIFKEIIVLYVSQTKRCVCRKADDFLINKKQYRALIKIDRNGNSKGVFIYRIKVEKNKNRIVYKNIKREELRTARKKFMESLQKRA